MPLHPSDPALPKSNIAGSNIAAHQSEEGGNQKHTFSIACKLRKADSSSIPSLSDCLYVSPASHLHRVFPPHPFLQTSLHTRSAQLASQPPVSTRDTFRSNLLPHQPWQTSSPVSLHQPWQTSSPVSLHQPWQTSSPVSLHQPWQTSSPVFLYQPWQTSSPVSLHQPWQDHLANHALLFQAALDKLRGRETEPGVQVMANKPTPALKNITMGLRGSKFHW